MLHISTQIEKVVPETLKSLSEFWEKTGDNISPFLTRPTFRARRQNTAEIEEAARSLRSGLNQRPSPADREQTAIWTAKVRARVSACARTLLHIQNPELENLLLHNSMDSADRFFAAVGEYDPQVPTSDILQALRNVWIMNILQIIAGVPVEYSKSIFAYSLLYPYTDNYLDDPQIPDDAKEQFNTRLRERLCGVPIQPADELEKHVYDLIAIIENEYPRDAYPGVYESILCIQDGQIKSLAQHRRGDMVSHTQTVSISVEKGGASVLADCFLVCGHPDPALIRFSCGFGFLLQLIDDLQDIASDRASGSATLFSSVTDKKVLSLRVRKLVVFLHTALNYEEASPSPYARDVRLLFENNCMLLIYEAVFKNKSLFEHALVRELMTYTPIRPGSLGKVQAACKPLYANLG